MRKLWLMVPVVALASATASAEEPVHYPTRPAVYLGLYGGGNLALRTWDLGNHDRISKIEPGSSALVGFRLGLQILSRLALEAELGLLPMKSSTGDRNQVLTYNLDLLIHILPGRWTPVIEGGFGGYSSVSGDLGDDSDPRAHVGIGFRGLLTSWLALRVDVRDVFSDGVDGGGANNLELSAGLDFFVWRATEPPPDRDGDGVPDDRDACPGLAGPAGAEGCPDADGDGIRDSEDRCPRQGGPASTRGCPDGDQDGIADAEDRCPQQAGPAKTQGCPDRDGDGFADRDDRCPQQAGPASLKGCPDGDHDGLPDLDDRCPKRAGPVALKGCPDKDGDGIPDLDDRCPDVKGVKEQQGCMPEVAKKFSGAIKGITFGTNSAKILPASHKVLDEAVAAMKEYPTLKLTIEGHTDNVGKPAKNQELSQSRAEAVRDYLVGKGIEAGRVQATGHGDTRPVEDNKKAKGRAANRRIEFKLTTD